MRPAVAPGSWFLPPSQVVEPQSLLRLTGRALTFISAQSGAPLPLSFVSSTSYIGPGT